MKQIEIAKVIAQEIGFSGDLLIEKINEQLKSKNSLGIKFRLGGKALGHLGLTGPIKSITDDGLKVAMVNKVVMVKFTDIETFQKAKPRSERPVYDKPKPGSDKAVGKLLKAKKYSQEDDLDDDDDEIDGDEDFETAVIPKKKKKRPRPTSGKSSFIPAKGRKNS